LARVAGFTAIITPNQCLHVKNQTIPTSDTTILHCMHVCMYVCMYVCVRVRMFDGLIIRFYETYALAASKSVRRLIKSFLAPCTDKLRSLR